MFFKAISMGRLQISVCLGPSDVLSCEKRLKDALQTNCNVKEGAWGAI